MRERHKKKAERERASEHNERQTGEKGGAGENTFFGGKHEV